MQIMKAKMKRTENSASMVSLLIQLEIVCRLFEARDREPTISLWKEHALGKKIIAAKNAFVYAHYGFSIA